MKSLLNEISHCTVCSTQLEHEPRPVLAAHEKSKIIIIGQAPGAVVHRTGVPWNDKSGENLRSWLGVDTDLFYDPKIFALIPMGFCYPGTGKSGDLPPRKECAPLWHQSLLNKIEHAELVILIGAYAQKYYLKKGNKKTLTETVKGFHQYLPNYFVLPHPSPRNNIWQAKNPWFKEEVLPTLNKKIQEILLKN